VCVYYYGRAGAREASAAASNGLLCGTACYRGAIHASMTALSDRHGCLLLGRPSPVTEPRMKTGRRSIPNVRLRCLYQLFV